MAEINSLTGADAPIPSNEGTTADSTALPRGPQRDDIDDATSDAIAMLDLVRWVTEARQAVDNLNVMQQHWPELAARLRSASICTGSLEWTEFETFGLQRLHLCIRTELSKTRTSANLDGVSQ